MKKTLTKTGANVKTVYSHLDTTAACSIVEDAGTFESFESEVEKVEFLLESPDTFKPECDEIITIKENMQMKHVSNTIRDKSVAANDVMSFLPILAEFLKSSNVENQRASKSNHKSVLSPAIQKLAEKSRIHIRERLLKRSIRHAMDKAVPSAVDIRMRIGHYKDEMVTIFQNKVKPSMTKGSHATKMCFNGHRVVGSSCYCKSGCKLDSLLMDRLEKSTRTHAPSLAVSLHAFLHDGLGTHLLVELRMKKMRNQKLKHMTKAKIGPARHF